MPHPFFSDVPVTRLPKKVVFLDFDGTIALTAKNANGTYAYLQDGAIGATHLDKGKFKQLVQIAIQHDIPLYFVTGRTDTQAENDLLTHFIEEVDGFHDGQGGFKRDSIYFISQMVCNNGHYVHQEITTKAKTIQGIHITKYSYLNNNALLFVDDLPHYVDEVASLGYPTILADSKELSHFAKVESFMQQPLEIQAQQHMAQQACLTTP
jgi:hypothetical protein